MAREQLAIINDDGERTVIWHPPLDNQTIEQITSMLRGEQVFVGTFIEDPYQPSLYIQQEGFHDTKSMLLFDTNVPTRVIELTKGRDASEEHVIPAAVMAFASCARMLTMPAGGLYEEALTRGSRDSNLDLAFFHAGNGLDPQEWADVALCKTPRLKTKLSAESENTENFRSRYKPLVSSIPRAKGRVRWGDLFRRPICRAG